MFNVLFKLVAKGNEKFVITLMFILHFLFNLCFSSKLKWARFYFNYFIFIFTLFVSALLYFPLFLIKGRNLENAMKLVAIAEYLGQKVLGIELTVRNSKVLAKDGAAVIVTNHQSSLEILLISQLWRNVVKKVIGISKKELLYLFPYGPVNYLLGTMFISRNKGGYEDLDKIAREVVKEQAKALIMPEGTRNHERGTMLPFKRGAFYLAIKAQIPIIPMAISPFYFIDYNKPSFDKPRIIMQALDEIPTVGLTLDDVSELKERVRLQIWEAYKKLCQECMNNNENRENDEYNSNGCVIVE